MSFGVNQKPYINIIPSLVGENTTDTDSTAVLIFGVEIAGDGTAMQPTTTTKKMRQVTQQL